MSIEPRDIETLVELFESSGWDELHLKIDDFELFLSTDPHAKSPSHVGTSAPGPSLQGPPAAVPVTPTSAEAAREDHAAPVPSHWVAVTAPNLGTFYRAPKPGAAAFVEIGQAVGPDTELCLIEVMKLFTTLKAGIKGTVRRVCVEDAEMVEFGDVLFYIEPA